MPDVSQRHLSYRAATIGILMRQTANLVVAVVVLADPDSAARLPGQLLVGALGLWAIYRLLTRSDAWLVTAVDFAFTVAVALAIPLLVSDPHFFLTNSAPVAVAGTGVIGFAVSLPARVSLAMTLAIAAAYANGSAAVIGWSHVSEVFNLYYFALQWGTCVFIRLAEIRVASAVDAARAQRQTGEVAQRVTTAVRDYDREQLRLLHDTVASTLLMVGQGSAIAPDRLAAQARRDLDVLGDPEPDGPVPTELVGALRDVATHSLTAVRFTGLDALGSDGATGRCLIAATREALNNVDRHAGATAVTLDIGVGRIVISDDGRGFDPNDRRSGYGIAHSMIARMQTIGGSAEVDSTPGRGTVVTLSWPPTPAEASTSDGEPPLDPDQLIERTRTGYGLALSVYALLSLISLVPASFRDDSHPTAQIVLAVAAALLTAAAIPHTLTKRRTPTLVPAALLAVALVQTALLPASLVGTGAQWSQAATGWCLLPFILRAPVARGATLLVGFWFVLAAYTLIRDPSAHTAVNLGLGTASILAVQVFALTFNGLVADAAAESHRELTAHTDLLANDRINAAVQIEYRRRYADLLDNVRPLLTAWRDETPIDEDQRRRATAESRRLRALFSQSAGLEHPLLARLRAATDAAAGRGVDVTVETQGALPPLSDTDANAVATPLIQALAEASSSARITLITVSDELVASIVSRGVPEHAVSARVDGVDHDIDHDGVHVIRLGDAAWVTVRHRLEKGATPGDRTCEAGAVDLRHR